MQFGYNNFFKWLINTTVDCNCCHQETVSVPILLFREAILAEQGCTSTYRELRIERQGRESGGETIILTPGGGGEAPIVCLQHTSI